MAQQETVRRNRTTENDQLRREISDFLDQFVAHGINGDKQANQNQNSTNKENPDQDENSRCLI